MSLKFVQVDPAVREHPRVRKLARRLRVTAFVASSHLIAMWCFAAQHYEDGDISDLEADDLGLAACWDGDEDALFAALVDTGWILEKDGRRLLHGWHRYDKVFRERERMRAIRERQRGDSKSTTSPEESRQLEHLREIARESELGPEETNKGNQGKVREGKSSSRTVHEPYAYGGDSPSPSPSSPPQSLERRADIDVAADRASAELDRALEGVSDEATEEQRNLTRRFAAELRAKGVVK